MERLIGLTISAFQFSVFQRFRRKVRGEQSETKEMTLATLGFVSQDMLTDPFPFLLNDPFSLFRVKPHFTCNASRVEELTP